MSKMERQFSYSIFIAACKAIKIGIIIMDWNKVSKKKNGARKRKRDTKIVNSVVRFCSILYLCIFKTEDSKVPLHFD